MTLVVIVISLILERLLGRWQHLRKLSWFTLYRGRLFALLPEQWQQGFTGGLILLAIPVLLVLILQGHDWGLWNLLLSLLVLTYCLGPEAFNERIDDYLQACEAHDRLRAKAIAESLVGESVSDNVQRQTQIVATAILYEGNVRIFAVLFWFIVLGPAGALLYRCASFLTQDTRSWAQSSLIQAADKLFALLDWIPARLLSLSFFLVGSFDDALQAWKRVYQAELGLSESNRSIVINTGCGAMRHDVDAAFDDSDEAGRGEKYDLYWVRTARALVLRALLVWLLVIALLTMAGWFV